MKKKALLLLAATAPWILAACNTSDSSSSENNENTLDVYTTVYPLQYFTEEIGGEYVNVETIYPPGADEHTFEPSQRDMIDLAEGDLFFYIGLGLEGFVDNATDVLQSEDLTMVATADYVSDAELGEGGDGHNHGEEEHAEGEEHAHDEEEHAEGEDHAHGEEEHAEGEEHAHGEEEHAEGEEHAHGEEEHAEGEEHAHGEEEHAEGEEHAHDEEEHAHEEEGHEGHDHGDTDPHLWLDPVLSQSLAESIKDSLVEKMPEQEAYFNENYEELVAQLDELNHEFEELAAAVTLDQFFVSHAAFGYWESRYGLNQQAIAGLSTTDEPSQRELTEIVESARSQNLEHILVEQNVSSSLTDVIQVEIGAEALPLHNLSTLTEEDIENEETYFTLMERNIESLRTAMKAE
ncbi:metal ABC transporter solute-binding protein, Zn/Mn family [Jeotgalibacillus sp. R-1-5s-1]|uniref:metal ABC transporter solute-binding protein, Zn/Mn family n=1 Tax=Jeotgalibacillus sp. R-1-5s-1 TaxID=2555897 RepID=UPI00106DB0DC|nr:zinc ABC transporter substrate-binding protein [Jeotgalibacillus sp. R-1-5s-1]TFD98147.1 hypothetical protein E2491_08540 [Jeotgalibacillus sp. R-1-5s-1]